MKKKCGIKTCPNYPGTNRVSYQGNFSEKVMIVGESPGREEIIEGHPFVGASGKLLNRIFLSLGIERSKVFIANAAMCRIDKNGLSTKQVNEVLRSCRGYIKMAVEYLKPKIIVTLGEIALRQVAKVSGGVKKRHGSFMWSNEFNCYILSTFHPAFCLRSPSYVRELEYDLSRLLRFVDNDYTIPDCEVQLVELEDAADIFPLQTSSLAIDTETQGINWSDPNSFIISYSMCNNFDKAYQVYLHHLGTEEDHDFTIEWEVGVGKKKELKTIYVKKAPNYDKNVDTLKRIIEDPNIRKCMFNGAFDLLFIYELLRREKKFDGITHQNFAMDVQVAAHLIDENKFDRCSLETVRKSLTRYEDNYSDTFDSSQNKGNMIEVPREQLTKYAALDAFTTLLCGAECRKLIHRNKHLRQYFDNFLMPMVSRSLFILTWNGAFIDKCSIPQIKNELSEQIVSEHNAAVKLIPQKIASKHSDKLRLSRDALVRDTLFSEDGFKLTPPKKTDKGAASVDDESRKILRSKRLKKSIEQFLGHYELWRKGSKLLNTYINAFENSVQNDGRIHPRYSVVTVVTGRTSSQSPNFQNLPKRGFGSEHIRRLIVAPEGKMLIAVDESQSELRWLAQLSKDPTMMDTYRKGGDIHVTTALALLGKREDELTKSELKEARQAAKCFHPDTEVLTRTGWKKILELSHGEEIIQAIPVDNSIKLEWCVPTLVERRENHCSTLVHLHNEGVNIHVTPDHRMLVQRRNGKFDVTVPHKFVSARGFWNSGFLQDGCSPDVDESFIRLAVAIQADGSISNKKTGTVRFGFYKNRKIERLLMLLHKCNLKYKVAKHKNGVNRPVTAITVYDCLANVHLFLDDNKCFTFDILCMDRNTRNIFLDELRFWDSHQRVNWESFRYSTAIKQNADVVQAVASSVGIKSKIVSKYNWFDVSVSKKSNTRGGAVHLHEYDYTEDVAVLSVPSSFILCRCAAPCDRQVPIIIGQSINFGLIYGMKVPTYMRHARLEYGLDLTEEEATRHRNVFFSTYKRVGQYHQEVIEFVHAYEFVMSPFGRMRRLPSVNDRDKMIQYRNERQALNHGIQSASSDTVLAALTAMILDGVLPPEEILPIMFVHDELVFECDEDKVNKYLPIVKHYMENPPVKEWFNYTMDIPLKSDAKVGDTFGTLEDYVIDTKTP